MSLCHFIFKCKYMGTKAAFQKTEMMCKKTAQNKMLISMYM